MTGRELLLKLEKRVSELEAKVEKLEKERSDDWLDEEVVGSFEELDDPASEALRISKTEDEDYVVDFPRPTPEQRELRSALLPHLGLEHMRPPLEDTEVYIKGGPLWLAAYDHDFVIGLPKDVRQTMVEDVAMAHPELAMELSRDILKERDAEQAGQISLEEQKRRAGLV